MQSLNQLFQNAMTVIEKAMKAGQTAVENPVAGQPARNDQPIYQEIYDELAKLGYQVESRPLSETETSYTVSW